jgi:C4-dicarboxylate transporter DctM subunit
MAVILFLSLAVFLLMNIPIAVSLGLSSFITLLFAGGGTIPLTMIPQRIFTSMDSFPFMAVPFFMLAGGLMESGGISKRLINFAKNLVGALPGGLGIITVLSSAFFGALSGSNAATVAAIGGIMIPAMVKAKYSPDFASALTAAAGTLGVVVPPSVPMITYAIISGVSVGALFMSGILPAAVMVVTLTLTIMFLAGKYNLHKEKVSLSELGKSFVNAIFALLMPIIILGGIYGGVYTPTEAAAIAVVYSLIVSLFIYREIKFKDLYSIIIKAGKNTAIVLFVIATSGAFSWLLTAQRIPEMIAQAILSISSNPIIIMLLINLLLLILGVFLETNAIILLVTPMLLPVTAKIGVDPLVLGIIMVINTSVGMITPPMALNIMIASSIGNQTTEQISKKIIPFLIVLIIDILIITFIPQIATFLPMKAGLI